MTKLKVTVVGTEQWSLPSLHLGWTCSSSLLWVGQSRELRPQRASGLNASKLCKEAYLLKETGILSYSECRFSGLSRTYRQVWSENISQKIPETNDPSVLGQVALSQVKSQLSHSALPCLWQQFRPAGEGGGVLEETVCIRLPLGHLCKESRLS